MAMNVPLVSFNGGEIGKEAMARVDLDVYSTCAETMENVFPLLAGGMIKAPGTIVSDETPSSGVAIVRPFIYNVDDTLTLEFSDNIIRVDLDGGTVQVEGAAATVGSPVNNSSSGGASVSAGSGNLGFTCVSGGLAKGRWPITTAAPSAAATFTFDVQRRPLKIQVGTTTSNADIMAEREFLPGSHVITVTPGAGTYYIQAMLEEPGGAIMTDPVRMAPGDLRIPSPYSDTEFRSLRYRQSNNAYYLFHPDHRSRVLERYSNYDWSLRYLRPHRGPFEPVNTKDITLTPNVRLGTVTVDASKAVFASTMVGKLIELTHSGQVRSRNINGNSQTTDSIRVVGAGTDRAFVVEITGTFTGNVLLERSIGNETNWQTFATYTTAGTNPVNDALDDQIIYYRLNSSSWSSGSADVVLTYSLGETTGRCEIIQYNSTIQVLAEIFDDERFGATTATSLWALGSWGDDDGWPAAGAFQDNRLHLVGEDRYWFSESDDYEGFEVGEESDDAGNRRMAVGNSSNTSRWLETSDRIMVGTTGEMMQIRSSALDEAITPANVNLRGGKAKGVADAQPIVVDDRVVVISRNMKRLVQLYPNGDKFGLDDLTYLHKHIAGRGTNSSGFIEIAYQEEPEPRIYCVRQDGELAVITFKPDQQVYAWARYTEPTGGGFESVCVTPGVPEDYVDVIVRRVIDGAEKRFRERFAPQDFDDSIEAVRVQSAVVYDGVATDTISGLDHLEGMTVAVWANGRVHDDCVVDSGSITLNYEVTHAVVGLNYVGKWKSVKLAYGARYGTALGQDKKVERAGLIVLETPVGAVGYGRNFEAIDWLIGEYEDGMIMDEPVTLITDEISQPIEGATETDARFCVIMDKPTPATVLAVIPNVNLSETTG